MVDTADTETDSTVAGGGDDSETTSFPVVAGGLYARWTLDCLVECGHHVSRDFFTRPEFYKTSINDRVVDLRLDYGTKNVPNAAQRSEMCTPIFGASDGGPLVSTVDKFRSLRKPLLDACTAFSERSVADASAGLQQSILSALALFQSYLKSFNGTSSRTTYHQISSVSKLAYGVLSSDGVRQVFGVTSPISRNWPLTDDDADGALLIRAIGENLTLPPELVFTEEKFQRLRRIAQQGDTAIRTILEGNIGTDDGFKTLVAAVYTWAIALRDYGIPS